MRLPDCPELDIPVKVIISKHPDSMPPPKRFGEGRGDVYRYDAAETFIAARLASGDGLLDSRKQLPGRRAAIQEAADKVAPRHGPDGAGVSDAGGSGGFDLCLGVRQRLLDQH